MTKAQDLKTAKELLAIVQDFYLPATLGEIQKIQQISNELRRWHLDYCNTQFPDNWYPMYEDVIEYLEAQVIAIVAEFGEGFGVYSNRDPRGSAIGIITPNGRYNSWGGAECGWRI